MSAKDIIIAAAGGGQTTTSIEYVGGKTVTITQSTTSNTTISLTDLTGSPDPTLLPGDVVIVSYVIGATSRAAPTITSNAYTEIANLYRSDTYETNLYSAYKVMGATPDTSVTVGPTLSTNNGGCVAIQAYRYVDETFPLQAPANTVETANTVKPTPPTITPWDDNSIAVIVGAGAHTRGNVAYTTTGLTNFISTGSTDRNADASIGAGFRVIQSGSYSPSQFGFSQADSTGFSCAALSVALKPKPDTIVPSFVSYRTGQLRGTGLLTITAPTGIQENDFILLIICADDNNKTFSTIPSGFTLLTTLTGTTGGAGITTLIYRKIATASEPASYSVAMSSGATDYYTCTISVFRNANTIEFGPPRVIDANAHIALGMTPTYGGLNLAIFTTIASLSYTATFTGMTQIVRYDGRDGATDAQAIYAFTAGWPPYDATPNRQNSFSVDHDNACIQAQLTYQ
jgi:hypothetical protein